MNEFKRKALIFSIVGIGIVLVLGGLGLFLTNKNHEVKYEKTLQPGEMFKRNEQLGRGKYTLKLECIGQGYCKGKGTITTGGINWD
ncbi:hypothetical protein [Bacillus mycoides]|uniref:hypothetical protein n=1 Tax=Bacillus mycoides TaxID=1405 RepID=UPI003802D9AE